MAKWKTAGIIVLMVGLMAFGAFAMQHRATMTRAQVCAAECSEECEPMREMREEMRQEMRLQQLLGEEYGPHGNGGGRQMRRAGLAN